MTAYRFKCHKVRTEWVLTGDLDKGPWPSLEPVGDLVLSNGRGAPSQPTRVWACWSEACLFVAFSCRDTDIRASYTERDDKVWQEEAVEFFVSPTGDLKNYYEFQFSPRNVVRDILVHNPDGRMAGSEFHGGWNCLDLVSVVKLDGVINDPGHPDIGWSLEAAVPFSCLIGPGETPKPGSEWRINFFRIYRRPVEEFCAWAPTFIDPWEFHVPERFGHLVFEDG